MSGTTNDDSPALKQSVQEVQAAFPNDAALEDAMGRLGLAGYDRSDFSLPHDREGGGGTPNNSADNPTDETDKRQLQTMGTSMAAFAGAAALAGATIATGGAAGVAAAGAAAVGAGVGAAAAAGGAAVDRAGVKDRDKKGAEGRLILAVRTRDENQVRQVTEIVQAAGATKVTPVTREGDAMTAGVSSASWTGA